MKKLSYTQHSLIQDLEKLALSSYESFKRGEKYGLSEKSYSSLFSAIDNALTELRGSQIWYKGYIDGELEFEEALTASVIEYQADVYSTEYRESYDGTFELTIIGYDTETDEEVSRKTKIIDFDFSPPLTDGIG